MLSRPSVMKRRRLYLFGPGLDITFKVICKKNGITLKSPLNSSFYSPYLVTAAICSFVFMPNFLFLLDPTCSFQMEYKSFERFRQGAQMWQTTDGQTDNATEKCVGIGGTVCAARPMSLNKITLITLHYLLQLHAAVVFFCLQNVILKCRLWINVFQGDLVYANYGEEKDFKLLSTKGVSCQDKIVILRYGRIFPGQMVDKLLNMYLSFN